jgi:hypothetical protein
MTTDPHAPALSSGPGGSPTDTTAEAPQLPLSSPVVETDASPGPEPAPLTSDQVDLVKALQMWDAAVTEREQLRRGFTAAKRLLDYRVGQLAEARAEVLLLQQRITELEEGAPS